MGMGAGAMLCIGIIEIVTGHAVINLSRSNWSPRENRASGACTTVQAITLAMYALIGGLALGTHSIPVFWVGHWWGLFAPAPFAAIILGTMFVQAHLQIRHERGRQVPCT